MKADKTFGQHLIVRRLSLRPGAEWTPKPPGWSVVRVASGVGYWLHPRQNRELDAGSVVILSQAAQGVIRASHVGEVELHSFNVEAERLTGVVTLGEQTSLQEAAARGEPAFRWFPPEDPVSVRLGDLFGKWKHGLVNMQLQMELLTVFIQGVGNHAISLPVDPEPCGLRRRLEACLQRMPVWDLVHLEFADLAQQIACSPRHLRRIFVHVVGVSFREKQTEVRLARAQELLATTESTIREVAVGTGYRSASLFHLMFKRRFGVTPRRWRSRVRRQQRSEAVGESGNGQVAAPPPLSELPDREDRRLSSLHENTAPVGLLTCSTPNDGRA